MSLKVANFVPHFYKRQDKLDISRLFALQRYWHSAWLPLR